MKKCLWLLLVCLAYTIATQAQPYGNEWINYSKTYYKLKVGQEGLYRIPFSTLSAEGLGSNAGSSFKMFTRGQEIPIYVSNNGTLSTNDYIEFIGEINDGSYDTQLYAESDWQLNPHRSMFSDTSTYYLVVDATGTPKRYLNTSNDVSSPPVAPETFFIHKLTNSYVETHVQGKPFRIAGVNHHYPDFEEGEGFASNAFGYTATPPDYLRNFNLSTPARYTGAGAPNGYLETRLVGRNDIFEKVIDHFVQIEVNGTAYAIAAYRAYDQIVVADSIFPASFTGNTTTITARVLVDSTDLSNIPEDANSMSFIRFSYPRRFDFDNANRFMFTLANSQQKYLEIENFNGGSSFVLYDMTNRLRIIPVFADGKYKVLLPAGTNPALPRKLYIASTSSPCNLGNCSFPCVPSQCATWSVGDLTPRQFTNFGTAANQGNYIMISHPTLRTGATDRVLAFANYRESIAGGGYNVVLADIEELYDQFGYGIPKHPLAIRHFIDYAFNVWASDPQYLFLVGKSVRYSATRTFPAAHNACLIPSWGDPASDNMLSATGNNDYYQRLATGRISALTPSEVKAYYDKVVEYESEAPCTLNDRAWTKRFAHIASGWYPDETSQFQAITAQYKEICEDDISLGATVSDFSYTNTAIPPLDVNFTNEFNNGLAMVSLVGHSVGSDAWNFGISPDPNTYTNNGKYPFMLTGSCFVGNIHEFSPSTPHPAMGEKYTLIADKGAIGYMATVQFGIPIYLEDFGVNLYQQFSNLNYNEPMGLCMLNSLHNLYTNDVASIDYQGRKVTTQEYTLMGDPAVVLVSSYEQPEYTLSDNATYNDIHVFAMPSNVEITSNPGNVPGGTTSLNFVITVHNLGQAVAQNFAIRINRQNGATSEQAAIATGLAAPFGESTYTINVPINSGTMSGSNTFTVAVDANSNIAESCEDNNTASVQLIIQDCVPPTVAFNAAIPTQYCTNTAATTLSATPTGGTFFLNGIALAGSSFDPDNANIGANTLSYQYTDGNNCLGQATLNINVSQAPSTQINASTLAICLDETLTISPQNYSSGATYNWNGFGGGTATPTGNPEQYQLSWTTPGTKTITLDASANNCTSTATTITVQVSAPLATPTISCGTTTTNSVTFNWTAVAGASGYILNLNGNLINLPATDLSYTANGLGLGETATLSLIAQGNAPCGNSNTSLQQACTAQNCESITPVINNIETIYCINQSAFALQASPAGGSFLVDGAVATQFNPATLGAGSHTVEYQVTVNGTCQYASQVYQVTIYALPEQPVISGNNLFCQGESTTLSVADGYSTYNWGGGDNGTSITVTNSGTYGVTVTNQGGLGCSASDAIDVAELPEPELNINAPNNGIVCNGTPINLSATLGYTYQWTDQVGTTLGSSSSISVINGGVYTVNIVDNNGCTASEQITVTENTITPLAVLVNGATASTTNTICGNSAVLDAGSGYATYAWSTGATTQSITVSEEAAYNVVVTNENGCSDNAALVIIFGSELSVDIDNGDGTICNGETLTLDAGNYAAYLWNDGSTGQTLSVSASGTYSVTVTNADGCSGSNNVAVIADAGATPEAEFAIASTGLCVGENLQLTNQSLNASSSSWIITNTTTGNVLTSSDTNPNITLSEAGLYSIRLVVQSTCSGATDELIRTESITVSNGPDINIIANFDQICPGDEITLESSGTANIAVAWLIGTTVVGNQPSLTDDPMASTVYTLTATDEFGCLASDTTEVIVAESCELPTVITPNGDGYNDTWKIPQANLANIEIDVEIYNRWGQLVYNQSSYSNGNGFDGTNNDGSELTHGTYYFVIRFSDNTEPLAGNLTIVR
jgi:gliding motility-associated-like protein